MFEIRPALNSDLEAIATVLVESWRAAYEGIMPAELLASQSVAQRRSQLERIAERPLPRRVMLVAYEGRHAVGTAWVGPDQGGEPSGQIGEVYAMYVTPSRWRAGIGAALMDRCLDELRAEGFESAVLWVLHNNEAAQRFYEQQGWIRDSAIKLEEWGAFQLQEVRYLFSPL